MRSVKPYTFKFSIGLGNMGTKRYEVVNPKNGIIRYISCIVEAINNVIIHLLCRRHCKLRIDNRYMDPGSAIYFVPGFSFSAFLVQFVFNIHQSHTITVVPVTDFVVNLV